MPETGSPEVTDEASLYAVVPEQFVAARDTLARRLRSEGDKAGAARVAKLRRPPQTVWALNQVARMAPELLGALQDAGRELRAAMERALEGDASDLRHARAQERSAVDAVVAEADRRLEQGGYPPTDVMHQRMVDTLRAAIVDQSVAELLRQGILDRDREASGFGMDALSAPLSRPGPAPAAPRPQPAVEAPERAGVPDVEAPERAAERAERARRIQEAQREADRLAAQADELVAAADRLASEAGRLAAEAQEAEQRASDARHRADAALAAAAAQRTQAGLLASTQSP